MNAILQRKAAERAASPDSSPASPPHEADDEFAYWRYEDLVERRIITDRSDLLENNWITAFRAR